MRLHSEDQGVGGGLTAGGGAHHDWRLGHSFTAQNISKITAGLVTCDLNVALSDADLILGPAGEVGDVAVLEPPDSQPVSVPLPGDEVAAVPAHLRLHPQVSPSHVVPGDHGLRVAANNAHQGGLQSLPWVDPVAGRGHLGSVWNILSYGQLSLVEIFENFQCESNRCSWAGKS